jgi:hypothetical protein
MNDLVDPLADSDTQRESTEPTRECVKSFWVACAGLACLTYLMALVAIVLSNYAMKSIETSFVGNTSPTVVPRAWIGLLLLSFYGNSSICLLPGLALISIVPILYWRGDLFQRFAISIVMGVTMANMFGNGSYYGYHVPSISNWISVGMWIGLPCLFLWSPIRIRSLRLIVSGCVMVLLVCVSFIHMSNLPQGPEVIYWLTFYGASFAFALVRRNWGSVVFFERTATSRQLERTSTKTLLELMVICGFACSFVLYWTRRMDEVEWFSLGIASAHGIITILLSVVYFKIALDRCKRKVRMLAIAWLIGGVWMSIIGFVVNINQNVGSFTNGMELWYLSTVIGASFWASFLLVMHLLLCGAWLRWNGWHSNQQVENCQQSLSVQLQ